MLARTSVDVDFLEPDVIQRRIADITAGNQQSWGLRRITGKNHVDLRAAVAVAVLTPRSMATQIIDVLLYRRDHTTQVELIHQSKRTVTIVQHGKNSSDLRSRALSKQ